MFHFFIYYFFFVGVKNLTSNEDEAIRMETSEFTKDTMDEVIIDGVRARPPLWNYKLPRTDRFKLKLDALWAEISNMIGGEFVLIKNLLKNVKSRL